MFYLHCPLKCRHKTLKCWARCQRRSERDRPESLLGAPEPGQSHRLTGAARWGRRVQHLLTCARLVYCRPCVRYSVHSVARVTSVYSAGNAERIQDPSPTKQPSTRTDHAATVCGVALAEGDQTISADWSSQVPARVLAINDILSPRGLLQAFCT